MKRLYQSILTLSLCLLFPGVSISATVSDYPANTPAGGIALSRHNLGKLGRVITTSATTEICVFCHTPHHTNTSYGVTPLWNRAVQNPSTYSAYGSTLAGTNITTVGSTTLACLSCHDGITTFDNIVNAPGKDGVVPGGSDRGWAFQMPIVNEFLPPNPAFHNFNTAPLTCSLCHPIENPAVRLSLTTNLSDDHPVSVPYNAGSAASLRDASTVISSINLTLGLTTTNENIAQNLWAVSGFISNSATISDLLRNGKVECSSCHDPHFKNESWDEVESMWAINPNTGNPWTWCANGEDCSDGNFLRRVGGNTGSGVCRTCHNK